MRVSRMFRLLAAVVMTVLLCGCDKYLIGGESQLMRPPYPAGEARKIQEQLTKELGVFTLKYPKNGDYRSAIIRVDLNGNGTEEALVFYRKDASEPISLAVLGQNEKGWQVLDTRKSEGGEVERVMFGNVNNDKCTEIIVGWTMYSTGLNIISAYSFNENRINPIDVREFSETQASNISVAYTDMQIHDFDNDGCDEIIASYINLSEVTATAKLIEFHRGVDDSNAMSVTDTAPLDGHVLYYVGVKKAKLDDNVFGVALDGYKDNSKMVTEYIYWDSLSGDLKTPFYSEEDKSVVCTARSIYTTSRDIDSDDVLDIPVTEYLPGYDDASDSPMYLTSWYNADFEQSGYNFIRRKRTVINTAENYSVTWQSSWDDNVTCRIDEKNRILYFYHYQKDKFAFSDEIFRIRVFSVEEWESQLDELATAGSLPDYIVLDRSGDTLYIALFAQGQSYVYEDSVVSYFSLMK